MALDITVAFPSSRAAVDHAVMAEELGYKRAWFYDSPALYTDVWVTLALVAERTKTIGIGPATLIPHLRHPMTQAAAVATLEEMAPGRLAIAIGTGFTGRMTMGQRPLTRAYFERYLRQLKALLAGEQVEIEGKLCQMMHPQGYGPARPIDVPFLLSAGGPKGEAFAREFGAAGTASLNEGFEWSAPLFFGTVLDEGEAPDSERASETIASATGLAYHATWERTPERLASLPRGAEWKAAVDAVPEAEQHLAVHDGHLIDAGRIDRATLDLRAEATRSTYTPEGLRERLLGLRAQGATEIMWQPMGTDIPRELRTFADAVALQDGVMGGC